MGDPKGIDQLPEIVWILFIPWLFNHQQCQVVRANGRVGILEDTLNIQRINCLHFYDTLFNLFCKLAARNSFLWTGKIIPIAMFKIYGLFCSNLSAEKSKLMISAVRWVNKTC